MRGFSTLALALVMGSAVIPAGAIEIERLVMPGPVIAGHADVEADCDLCHVRFSPEGQPALCLDCHEDVAADLEAGEGFHALHPDASKFSCASCHTDHEGRDAEIVILDTETFDHDFTDFELIGAHLEAECTDCHAEDTRYREAPQACFGCHEDDDEHRGGLGEDCADCHNPEDWADTSFDHEENSGFALLGGHAEAECVACHIDYRFEQTPTECFDCHASDDPHEGLNGRDCAFCHTVNLWTELLFDHARETGFGLLGKHGEIACTDCHEGNKFEVALEPTCISCHREDDEHKGSNGPECGDCHTTVEWAETTFKHDVDTEFPLLGAHVDVACGDCHEQPAREVTPPDTCFGCHEDDDPHEGQQGEDCATCHNEGDWKTDVAFDHDLTLFPLIGKHRDKECTDCHETPRFHDAPEQCVDCHLEDDVHEAGLGPSCGDCHNPQDWSFWEFDHARQTSFTLEGAHADLACAGCHDRPLEQQQLSFDSCVACHQADDVHRGEFGSDCERCHNTGSFSDVRRPR